MTRLGGDTPALADAALARWQRNTATHAAVLAAVDEVAARVKGIEPPVRRAVPIAEVCLLQALAEFVSLIETDWSLLRVAGSLS